MPKRSLCAGPVAIGGAGRGQKLMLAATKARGRPRGPNTG
jgi:hypothetical protein